jgi:hypothetical protein
MARCRPFKLIDAMILVAVAALGLTAMRPGWDRFQTFWAAANGAPTWQAYAGIARTSFTIAVLELVVAYIWIRLIPPRLPWRDLIRQPGMLLLILLIGFSFVYMAVSAFVLLGAASDMIIVFPLGMSWAAACFRYRARAEPGWIEGLGRCLGVGILIAIATTYPA